MKLIKLLYAFGVFNIAPQCLEPDLLPKILGFLDYESLKTFAQTNETNRMEASKALPQQIVEVAKEINSKNAKNYSFLTYEDAFGSVKRAYKVKFEVCEVEYLWSFDCTEEEKYNILCQALGVTNLNPSWSLAKLDALLKINDAYFEMIIYSPQESLGKDGRQKGLKIRMSNFNPKEKRGPRKADNLFCQLYHLFYELSEFNREIKKIVSKDYWSQADKPSHDLFLKCFRENVTEADSEYVLPINIV